MAVFDTVTRAYEAKIAWPGRKARISLIAGIMLILPHLTYFPSLSTALCAAGDHFVPAEKERDRSRTDPCDSECTLHGLFLSSRAPPIPPRPFLASDALAGPSKLSRLALNLMLCAPRMHVGGFVCSCTPNLEINVTGSDRSGPSSTPLLR